MTRPVSGAAGSLVPRRRARALATAARVPCVALLLALAAGGAPGPLSAQQIPRDEYIRFFPLDHPRLVRATDASERLALYGDPSDPAYRDRDPPNGVDDRRDRILLRLGRRFAPILVQNTAAFPMDFGRFIERGDSFPLHVDTWNLAGPGGTLESTRTVDFGALEGAPCATRVRGAAESADPADGGGEAADCALLELLREFHPERPASEAFRHMTVEPGRHPFRILYFDFPGGGEATWKEAYVDPATRGVPEEYAGWAKIYLHPFLRAVDGGYELLLQYWFFYPFNDGGNNHEGDWEHINVVVAPRNGLGEPLSEADVRAVLGGEPELFAAGGERELVLSRVEYYFHHQVMTLDYARPDAYLPEAAWRAEVEALARSPDPSIAADPTGRPARARVGERWLWSRIRDRAYRHGSAAGDRVNTHPVAFIGADNKGLDQLLGPPGGKNRDSHGTFPFPGLFKDVGPGGASEEIGATFDHREFLDSEASVRGGVWTVLGPRAATHGNPLSFWQDEGAIEILPDWERILPLVHANPEARRRWAWLVLPIRWGWPAVESPFAGVVGHAETGNLAPVGPAFNAGWNRAGASAGYLDYDPHRFPWYTPLSFRDSFQNELGFLNVTLPVLSNLPPLDLAWRILAAPFRSLLGKRLPVFYPRETVPSRFATLGGGVSLQLVPADFGTLLLAGEVGGRVAEALEEAGGPAAGAVLTAADGAIAWVAEAAFFAGKKFSTRNELRHLRTRVGAAFGTGAAAPAAAPSFRADLDLWELAGAIRYNLATGIVQPYVLAGYAWSWYRLEGILAGTAPLETPDSEWFQRPSLTGLDHLFPNTWRVGAGIEVIPRRSYAALPAGVDLGLRIEYGLFVHGLGAELDPAFAGAVPRDVTVSRSAVDLALTLGF